MGERLMGEQRTPRIALAVVDMAGTTVEENGAVERSVLAAIDAVTDGRRPEGYEERFREARGGAKAAMFRSILGDEPLAGRAHAIFEEELERRVAVGEVAPMPGAEEALQGLKAMGARVALTTGFSGRVREALLEELGWQGLADLVLSPAEDDGPFGGLRGRPHPDLVLAAAVRLGVGDVRAVAVAGDTVNDLLSGARAGASVVAGVLTGAHGREELEGAPHTHILPSIAEFPGAIAAGARPPDTGGLGVTNGHAGLGVARRLASVGTSVTSATTARAKGLRAAGKDVVNFAAGELDAGSPPPAVEAAARAARDERLHRYGPPAGLPELREAVARRLSSDGEPLARENVLVTSGTKQALYGATMALVEPGDEVLLPAPYWTSYPHMVRLAGGRVVEVPTRPEDGFRVSVEDLEGARTPQTKLLVYVSPSNPTGAVYPPEEARAIGEWALERGVWVLSDEIYDGLVYEPHVSVPITGLVPGLSDRCVRAGGVGKTYAMTGWRVGWLAGPGEVAKAASALQSHSAGHPSNVAQAAALAVLRSDNTRWLAGVRAGLARRRRLMLDGLRSIPGVGCAEPGGAFYAFPSFGAHLGTEVAGRRVESTLELAEVLLEEALVSAVPGEAFGAPGFLRLSYALSEGPGAPREARLGPPVARGRR